MKRKIFSILISVALLLPMILLPTYATNNEEASQAAYALYKLGLFKGTGRDANGNPVFELDRTPTRVEAVVMLIRLLDKEKEAMSEKWETPFTDVADGAWSERYIGYAYVNGLTSGIDATTFGGEGAIDATQYLTLVLRVLGYESGKDFRWDAAWELSDKIGLTNGEYSGQTDNFTRGDVAIISRNMIEFQSKVQVTAFETLADITKTNGSINENGKYQYDFDTATTSGSKGMYNNFSLYYDPAENEIELALFSMAADPSNDAWSYFSVYIPSSLAVPYDGAMLFSSGDSPNKGLLEIQPTYFGEDTRLSFTSYEGIDLLKDSFAGLYAGYLWTLLRHTEKMLLKPNGFTLADLGFTRLANEE